MIPLLKQLAQKNTKIAKQRMLILHMIQFYFILLFGFLVDFQMMLLIITLILIQNGIRSLILIKRL